MLAPVLVDPIVLQGGAAGAYTDIRASIVCVALCMRRTRGCPQLVCRHVVLGADHRMAAVVVVLEFLRSQEDSSDSSDTDSDGSQDLSDAEALSPSGASRGRHSDHEHDMSHTRPSFRATNGGTNRVRPHLEPLGTSNRRLGAQSDRNSAGGGKPRGATMHFVRVPWGRGHSDPWSLPCAASHACLPACARTADNQHGRWVRRGTRRASQTEAGHPRRRPREASA